jgi:hypothetical protein
MKQTNLRSLYIRFEQPPVIEIQRIERVIVDGEVVAEGYLPLERYDPQTLSDAERAVIDAALGEVVAATQVRHLEVQGDLEVAQAALREAETRLSAEQVAHQVTAERLNAIQDQVTPQERFGLHQDEGLEIMRATLPEVALE